MPNSRRPNRPGPGRSTGTGRNPGTSRSAGTGRSGARGSAAKSSAGKAGTKRTGSNRRSGASHKPTTPAQSQTVSEPTVTREESPTGAVARRRASLTTRAIALAVVVLILTISYASSLRVYFKQRQDIADTKQQIINAQRNISELSNEISRWNDPNYVRTQARDRLGWVVPGERGYRVIGADGQPVTGDTEIAAEKTSNAPKKAWYTKMWGSVETADDPRPAKKDDPADKPPITEKTKRR
ncbi:FtsB family cell division protein [Microlunatus soli]|uniref:Cell division protein FtsB n=1 Tax=Microlunatus soli TaxID=630515 RepID=A0A1H1QW60_9ACTN|nr:septum formation initiator family protein [Microlunatus soli]SDS27573.1 Cell division protein FtsB [Microlunatus soli]